MIGHHASDEQFTPSELLHYTRLATAAGFTAVNCSNPFHPWCERQGQSGFSFAWLGAAAGFGSAAPVRPASHLSSWVEFNFAERWFGHDFIVTTGNTTVWQ